MSDAQDENDFKNLEEKLKSAKGGKEIEPSEATKAVNAGIEFTTPMLGGMLIGYGLDQWLGTQPIFIISLFLLGVAAGVMNIYKASQDIGGTIGYSDLHAREKNAKTSPDIDSDKKHSDHKTD